MKPLLQLVIAIVLIGCSSPALPAPVPPGLEKTVYYFPTHKGDRWVYVLMFPDGKTKDVEIEEVVTSVKQKDGIKIVSIGRIEDGKVYPNREREVSEKGVIQTKDSRNDPLDSPWIHLKIPHKAGQSWDVLVADEKHTAEGPEKITVPAGTYEAIRVEIRKRTTPMAAPFQTDWYAPRVGIVKIKTPDCVIVLKSFTPGKE